MYEISLSVSACLRAGTSVDVAWAVQAQGFGDSEPPDSAGHGLALETNAALALTPGGGRIGGIAAGAANDALADLAGRGGRGGTGRLVTVTVSDFEAQLAGLAAGGAVRCLLVPAADLPASLWDRLRDRDPVCLVIRLESLAPGASPPAPAPRTPPPGPGGPTAPSQAASEEPTPARTKDLDRRVERIDLYDRDSIGEAGEEAAQLFARGVSGALVSPDVVVSAFWPVPRLVIVGAGPIVDAVNAHAGLLGWRVQVVGEASAATGLIAGLAPLDSVLVAAHDLDLAGAALMAALRSGAGYLGALGSASMNQARAEWLAYRGMTDTSRVHGPAGLDIGARTPPEIAVAILAEALAVRAAAEPRSTGASGW